MPYKNNSRCSTDISVKCENIKILEEKTKQVCIINKELWKLIYKKKQSN